MPLEHPFRITYRASAFSRSETELAQADDYATALEIAAAKSREAWGRASPIFIRQGRKKIHEIPAGAGYTGWDQR